MGYKHTGFFRITKRKVGEERETLVGQGKNLTTKQGLTQILSTNFTSNYLALGDGTTEPSYADTRLANWLIAAPWYGSKIIIDPDEPNTVVLEFIFRLLESAGVGLSFRELGFSRYDYNSDIGTRALITDSEGNPITITKNANEVLSIYYYRQVIQTLPENEPKYIPIFLPWHRAAWASGGIASVPSNNTIIVDQRFYSSMHKLLLPADLDIKKGIPPTFGVFPRLPEPLTWGATQVRDDSQFRGTVDAKRKILSTELNYGLLRTIYTNSLGFLDLTNPNQWNPPEELAYPIATGDGYSKAFYTPGGAAKQINNVYADGVSVPFTTRASTGISIFKLYLALDWVVAASYPSALDPYCGVLWQANGGTAENLKRQICDEDFLILVSQPKATGDTWSWNIQVHKFNPLKCTMDFLDKATFSTTFNPTDNSSITYSAAEKILLLGGMAIHFTDDGYIDTQYTWADLGTLYLMAGGDDEPWIAPSGYMYAGYLSLVSTPTNSKQAIISVDHVNKVVGESTIFPIDQIGHSGISSVIMQQNSPIISTFNGNDGLYYFDKATETVQPIPGTANYMTTTGSIISSGLVGVTLGKTFETAPYLLITDFNWSSGTMQTFNIPVEKTLYDLLHQLLNNATNYYSYIDRDTNTLLVFYGANSSNNRFYAIDITSGKYYYVNLDQSIQLPQQQYNPKTGLFTPFFYSNTPSGWFYLSQIKIDWYPNILLETPPAAGAAITADFVPDGLLKTSNYSADISMGYEVQV